MAPSPTGEMHVGSMAILLKNYAFAKKNNGTFVLRIEDTDKVREVEDGVKQILDVIEAYGLTWDEGPTVGGEYGPYIQSQRLDLYTKWAQWLVEHNKAYYCFCSKERLEKVRDTQKASKQPPKYDKHCRNLSAEEINSMLDSKHEHVIRLKVPENETITFSDLIRGEISFNSSEIDDQVLLKSDGYPTYHLAVVVDDHLMQISHIMRGEEWISSTPKHILLYKAFNWELPVYAHIPVFLNPDGKGKMSKRKGTVSARSFLEKGYLPEALLNFFMILGWAHPEEKEILSLDEYIQYFDPKDVSSKSVVFDIKKLQWLNGTYIRKLTLPQLHTRLAPFYPQDFPQNKALEILPLVHERLVTLADIEMLTSFFYRDITIELSVLIAKNDVQQLNEQLAATIDSLKQISEWTVENIESKLRNIQESNNWHRGKYFMALRIATTGSMATPPLFDTMKVIGKDLVINRLQNSQQSLEEIS